MKNLNINFIKATTKDLNQIEYLYDYVNDYLNENTNYPNWIKGFYPVRKTAELAIKDDSLFLLKIDDDIAGSIILNHIPEEPYYDLEWGIEADYNDVFVIHTFLINPKYYKLGLAKKMLDLSKQYAIENNMKAIRLDTLAKNTPAITLYENYGFNYIGEIYLNFSSIECGLFRAYEYVLQK